MDNKALAILLTILQTESPAYAGLTARQFIQDAHALLALLVPPAPEPPAGPTTTLTLQTLAGGVPAPAQVKLFPAPPVQGIDVTRRQTDETGRLTLTIPATGPLLLEITHGPAFAPHTETLRPAPGTPITVTADLTEWFPLAPRHRLLGDLHHHSIYSSPAYGGTDNVTDTAADVCLSMRATGLHFGALADHHNALNHAEWSAMATPAFTPIISKEISTTNGHINALGATGDVVYKIPTPEDRTDAYLRAEHIRTADEIRARGGLPQVNHPRDMQSAISFPEAFTDIITSYEALEIWNGATPLLPGFPNPRAFDLWLSLLRDGRFLPATAGSDTHNIRADDYNTASRELTALHAALTQNPAIPDALRPAAAALVAACETVLPRLKPWAEQRLGTGCVVNCLHVDATPSQDAILAAIRAGNNLVTNGPFLFPTVHGTPMGQTARACGHTVPLHVELYAPAPLSTLTLFTMTGQTNLPLPAPSLHNGLLNYTATYNVTPAAPRDFFALTAFGSLTNAALANPVFVEG